MNRLTCATSDRWVSSQARYCTGNGATIAPIRTMARNATTISTVFGSWTPTTSPGSGALRQQHLRQPGNLLVELRPGQRADRAVQQRLPVQRVGDRRDVAELRDPLAQQRVDHVVGPVALVAVLPDPLRRMQTHLFLPRALAPSAWPRPRGPRRSTRAPAPPRPRPRRRTRPAAPCTACCVAGQRHVPDQLGRDGGQQLAGMRPRSGRSAPRPRTRPRRTSPRTRAPGR